MLNQNLSEMKNAKPKRKHDELETASSDTQDRSSKTLKPSNTTDTDQPPPVSTSSITSSSSQAMSLFLSSAALTQSGASLLAYQPKPPIMTTEMYEAHSRLLLSFAYANDLIMIWRPINKKASERLAQGSKGKAINTKGKSSEFGPIAADIPFDVTLSKLILAKDEKQRKLTKYQGENSKVVAESEKQITSIENELKQIAAAFITADDSQKTILISQMHNAICIANAKNLSVAMDKKDEKGCVIYYKSDKNGAVLQDDHPLFFKKDGHQYYPYVREQKQFDTKPADPPLGSGQEIKPVKIMAYVRWSCKIDELTRQLTYARQCLPITADYDELVTASRKVYPFLNNSEGISTRFTADLYRQLVQNQTQSLGTLTREDIAVSLIFEYEQRVRRDHRYRPTREGFGSVNDWQLALKIVQKLDTDEATNHGPEVNNPFPEKIEPANYPVHLHDGTISILKSEEEICQFINQQRALGFPLDVNPKWGWELDEKTRELYIPKVRFNWDAVHNGIQDQHLALEDLEKEIKELKEIVAKDAKEASEKAEVLEAREARKLKLSKREKEHAQRVKQYAEEVEIMHLKTELESLKLEPDIVYSESLSTYRVLSKEIKETSEEKGFRLAVSKKVREKEIEWRKNSIGKLNTRLSDLEKAFFGLFQFNSVVAKQEIALLQIQNQKSTSSLKLSS